MDARLGCDGRGREEGGKLLSCHAYVVKEEQTMRADNTLWGELYGESIFNYI